MKFNVTQLQTYLVAGTQDVLDGRDLPTILSESIEAGITAFQYREKGPRSLVGADRVQMGVVLRQICLNANIPFFVDDDVALAKELHADGIHVGQSDDAIESVIEVVPDLIIGYSCHTLAQIERANGLPQVDYVGSGPIFPTQSKSDADPTIGVDGLSELVHASLKPIVAIGGITTTNVSTVAQSQCAGASVISAITQADDVNQAVTALAKPFLHRNV